MLDNNALPGVPGFGKLESVGKSLCIVENDSLPRDQADMLVNDIGSSNISGQVVIQNNDG